MSLRTGRISRKTKEVEVVVEVKLDGDGVFEGTTSFKFLDHMIKTLCFFSNLDLKVEAKGDLTHHVIEDVGLAFGEAYAQALGSKEGINRFGYAYAPMDDALALAVVDLGGRPYSHVDFSSTAFVIEDTPIEDLKHFISSFAIASKATIHLKVLYGENNHHKVEASFKALALALKQASSLSSRKVPSVKGVI
ncbi:MAG: imidazoleglycerol-phosphate dehydratase [Candidatus Methanomethylicota archaeon]|uniref:Imidazoleglycerol-phosphate dehydratase n=1 Tax=Thermoproteota archaeon TaxID=2056631 RepID=A0A497ELV0_9CREN|nr:MAG: imidazoleglycerol-phosphate dehydratase [Candidatus Verstraetearchaeota archaeon]RLE50558.1 MAG: imidazoleglycerol-phosphate dehydratase [Candidatus Verstraetearchaeota archaeon]